MNTAEAAYAAHLDLRKLAGEIQEWRFEKFKLFLAPGAWYTIDFWVVMADGEIQVHEVKGHQREAARVRIKVAADLYPELRFVQANVVKHGRRMLDPSRWRFETFEPSGE